MMKILIVLGTYFPNASANGICVRQIVKELELTGIEVTILSNRNKVKDSPDYVDGTQVYSVKSAWNHRATDKIEKVNNPKIRKLLSNILKMLNKINYIVFFSTWPLTSPMTTFRYYRKAKKLHKEKKFDGLISVYSPINAVVSGFLMKNKFKDLKFMQYYLDSISGGIPPAGMNSKWLRERGYKWEKILFCRADNIYMMESHKSIYTSEKYLRYKNKIVFVDIPLLRELKTDEKHLNITQNKDEIHLVYTGSLVNHVRNPKYMLDIFENISLEKKIFVHIYGDGDCEEILTEYKNRQNNFNLINHGFVDYKIALNAMINADILINIGNNKGGLVPSKIFEYFSTGKPIISFIKFANDPSLKYLEKYPLSFIIQENKDNLEDNINKTAHYLRRDSKPNISYNDLKHIFKDNTPENVVNEIIKIS